MKDVAYLSDEELEADFRTLTEQILVELKPENRKILYDKNHWDNIAKMWERIMDIYGEIVDRA